MPDTPVVAANGLHATPIATVEAAPVSPGHRLAAIDATRGLALLGILMVNVQLFAEPLASFLHPEPEQGLSNALRLIVRVLCEGKFYVTFSLLFGMGLVLQQRSVDRAGGSFGWLYTRRLLVLMGIGFLHAVFLWYGDILFVYAMVGFVLLACSRLSARAMAIIGGIVLAITIALGGLSGVMMSMQDDQTAAVARAVAQKEETSAGATTEVRPPDEGQTGSVAESAEPKTPFFRLIEGYRTGEIRTGMEHPLWQECETQAFRDGPYLDATLFRAMTWSFFLIFMLLGFGWSIIAMFFLGAAVVKWDFLSPARHRLRVRLAVGSAAVGIPCAVAAALLFEPGTGMMRAVLAMTLASIASPLFACMYLCTMSVLVEKQVLRPVTGVLASVGKMALTNYLMQTLVCTFIFYHWGLGEFGSWTRAERYGLVLGIFAAQCVISPLWLSVFRFGPMEWVWRSLTYLKVQPMMRERASVAG